MIRKQQEEGSLAAIRALAGQNAKGYYWKDAILRHRLEDETGQTWDRIVLPRVRIKEVMALAHNNRLCGHFSHRKTKAVLQRSFMWPGMAKEIKVWCRNCIECQKAGKKGPTKVPLHPLPVIGTPFSKIAFDLVDPLPRTSRRHRYILTCMCLGPKYPDAIPLTKVDATTVADAMLDIFSRIGIPAEILTDQGSVFMGQLTKQLCSMCKIKHIRTSPYHPQTDGALERWHGTLKQMLRKCQDRRTDWDKILKYLLFAYRNTPHSNTGFSPFEVVYGRGLRSPLEVLKEGWAGGEMEQRNVIDWINELGKHLEGMREVVAGREEKARKRMKQEYDKKAKPRTFNERSMVLVRAPDIRGTLEDIWEGAYEVSRVISEVTLEIAVPTRRSRRRVVHINMVKEWQQAEATVLRVAVVQEEEEQEITQTKTTGSLTELQQQQLDQVLLSHQDVVTTRLGETARVTLKINTGEAPPTRVYPYQVPPAWQDQLREEVHSLAATGVLRPSFSPWLSPMVPVRKPDGSVRLCINYKTINNITTPDPYIMPRVDDLLYINWRSKALKQIGFE